MWTKSLVSSLSNRCLNLYGDSNSLGLANQLFLEWTSLMRALVAFIAGLLFAIGLVISGMTLPSRVIGFLDILGEWDPSLGFVMGGAILVHLPFHQLFKKRSQPILDSTFHLPKRKTIDSRLIGGSVLFGIGWGLSGFCPGPSLLAVVTTAPKAVAFVSGMVGGMLFYRFVETLYKVPEAS